MNEQIAVMKKVLARLRRYWLGLILSLVLATVSVVMSLYIPILVGDAIDCIVDMGRVDFVQMGRYLRKVLLCAAAAGMMLIGLALTEIGDVQSLFARLTALAGLKEGYLQTLLKALGVSYAAELASQVCSDLGEGGLAVKVGLMGKLCVFTLTAPLLMTILEMILELTP